jgi:hypothetical protein
MDTNGTYFEYLDPFVLENIAKYLDCHAYRLFTGEQSEDITPCETCIEAVKRDHSGCFETLHRRGGKIIKGCGCGDTSALTIDTGDTYRCMDCGGESYDCYDVALNHRHMSCFIYCIRIMDTLSAQTTIDVYHADLDYIRTHDRSLISKLLTVGIKQGVGKRILERIHGGPIPYSRHFITTCMIYNDRPLETLKYLIREQVNAPTWVDRKKLRWVRSQIPLLLNRNRGEVGDYLNSVLDIRSY